MAHILSVTGGQFITSAGLPEGGGKAYGQPEMVVVDIRAGDEEDAGPALQRAEGDVPADLRRKGCDSGILADQVLSGLGDEFAHGLVNGEGTCRHEVSLSREGAMGVWLALLT